MWSVGHHLVKVIVHIMQAQKSFKLKDNAWFTCSIVGGYHLQNSYNFSFSVCVDMYYRVVNYLTNLSKSFFLMSVVE